MNIENGVVRNVKMGVSYDSIKLLCTRSIDPNYLSAFADTNIQMDIIPFIATIPLVNNYLIDKISSLATQQITAIFTSANAVKAVANLLGNQKVNWEFACLDKATNFEIQKKFPDNKIVCSAPNAKSLATKLITYKNDEFIKVFFCGSKSLPTIPDALNSHQIDYEALMVYQTQIKSTPIDTYYNGIIFMSPSAVDSYFVCNSYPKNTVAFCIGSTTAEALTKKLSEPAIVVQAAEHTVASILEAVLVYYNR